MKKVTAFLLGLALALSLAACGQPGASASQSGTSDSPEAVFSAPLETADAATPQPEQADAPDNETGKTLVVYFSASGNTERVAGLIADTLGADRFELIPAEPYTSADLDWTSADSRVSLEHDNESLRDVELEANTVENWEDYDTVLIGYPIWWHIAAWPVNSFVKSNDFTGKTVIPFCTSSSSDLGESGELLAEMAGTGDWQTGMRFVSNISEDDVTAWASGVLGR